MYCNCYCSVALPHGAVGWSAVCDCGIFWSYAFFYYSILSFEYKCYFCHLEIQPTSLEVYIGEDCATRPDTEYGEL